MSKNNRREYTPEELWNPQIDLSSYAAAYGRQSTKEQYIENIQSHIGQTVGLLEEAKHIGFKDDGSTGKVVLFIENQVEQEDGSHKIKNASGTWPIDRRPGLKAILDLIEEGKIKTIIVEFVDRLFRDEDRIDSNIFIKTCKEHNCFVYVTSRKLVYNFANPQLCEMFRQEVAFAAAYIEHHIRGTMLRRRDQAVQNGQFGGGFIPMGFILCKEKGPKYHKLIPYEPHADIIRELAEKVLIFGVSEVCKMIGEAGVFFPDFEEGIEPGHRALDKVEGGYVLRSRRGLISLLTNRVNIGDIVYNKINVKGAHDYILEIEVYESLCQRIKSERRRYYQKREVWRVGILKSVICSTMWKTTMYTGTKSGDYYYRFQQSLNMTLEIGFCISAPQIESVVEERLLEKIRSYDLGSYEEELRSRQKQRNKRIKDIDTRLSSIEEEISNSADSLVKTNLKVLIDKINKKVAKIQKEAEELNTEKGTFWHK